MLHDLRVACMCDRSCGGLTLPVADGTNSRLTVQCQSSWLRTPLCFMVITWCCSVALECHSVKLPVTNFMFVTCQHLNGRTWPAPDSCQYVFMVTRWWFWEIRCMCSVGRPVGSTTLTCIGSTCSHLSGTWSVCLVSDLMDAIVTRWPVSATRCLYSEADGLMRFVRCTEFIGSRYNDVCALHWVRCCAAVLCLFHTANTGKTVRVGGVNWIGDKTRASFLSLANSVHTTYMDKFCRLFRRCEIGIRFCLQCFETVRWTSRRSFNLWNILLQQCWKVSLTPVG